MRNIVKIFGRIRVRFIKQILMVDFSGILDTGWAEDRKMMKDKLIEKNCKQV